MPRRGSRALPGAALRSDAGPCEPVGLCPPHGPFASGSVLGQNGSSTCILELFEALRHTFQRFVSSKP